MTDTTKTEALRLADWLDALCRRDPKFCTKDERPVAAAELRRLAFAEIGLRDRLRDREMDLANVVQHRDRLAAECEALRVVLRQAKAALNTARVTILTDDGAVDGTPKVVLAAVSAIDAAMGGKESQGGNGSVKKMEQS